MKIHILHNFVGGPWGGGNQFLKALRARLNLYYEEDPDLADVILVNSKDNLDRAKVLSEQGKTIVHRIDGIFSLYRGSHEKKTDQKVYDFAANYADGVVFQSHWSRRNHFQNGMWDNKPSIVIPNFVDRRIFHSKLPKPSRGKNSLVCTSWSANIRKGFDYLEFLDQTLNFDKYTMTFVGNSPVKFKNIKMIGPLPSEELADVLRTKEIFVTASQKDTCSNSLIESMACGCIPIVLDDGGNPELVRTMGERFTSKKELLEKIDHVSEHISSYRYLARDGDFTAWAHLAYRDFMGVLHENKHKH